MNKETIASSSGDNKTDEMTSWNSVDDCSYWSQTLASLNYNGSDDRDNFQDAFGVLSDSKLHPTSQSMAFSHTCDGREGQSDGRKRTADKMDNSRRCNGEELEGIGGESKKKMNDGPKRTRSAELHNMSERRRRDRIRVKLRALQQLIPNCNKVDRASMLEDAIKYLKALKLQVEIMSKGYQVPFMSPAAAQTTQIPRFSQTLPFGMGMSGMCYSPGLPLMSRTGNFQIPGVQMPLIASQPLIPQAAVFNASNKVEFTGQNTESSSMSYQQTPMTYKGFGHQISDSTMPASYKTPNFADEIEVVEEPRFIGEVGSKGSNQGFTSCN